MDSATACVPWPSEHQGPVLSGATLAQVVAATHVAEETILAATRYVESAEWSDLGAAACGGGAGGAPDCGMLIHDNSAHGATHSASLRGGHLLAVLDPGRLPIPCSPRPAQAGSD